jgi:hypothetical protein
LETSMKSGGPVPFGKIGDEEFRLGERVFERFLARQGLSRRSVPRSNSRTARSWAS